MARVGTPNLNLGTYVEGENPGAGSQTVDSDGLNGDRIKVDTALGAGHTAAGAHKANVIGPTQLAVSVVDGVTLTGAGGVVISVLNDGITGAKIAAAAVDNSTLEASAATGAKTFRVKDAGITGAKLNTNVADGATIEKSGSSLRVMDAGLQAAKLSTAVAAANIIGKGTIYIYDTGTAFFLLGSEFQVDATVRIPVAPKGTVVRFCHVNDLTGTITAATGSYYSDPNGLDFSSGSSRARLHVDYSSTKYRVLVEGSAGGSNLDVTLTRAAGLLAIEFIERP